jgi:hypothetical protein
MATLYFLSQLFDEAGTSGSKVVARDSATELVRTGHKE